MLILYQKASAMSAIVSEYIGYLEKGQIPLKVGCVKLVPLWKEIITFTVYLVPL